MVAPLCIFSPESGGMNDDEYVPNPVIASMQILDEAHGVQKLRSFPEVVRLGRQMGFSRTLIVDDDNRARVIAISEGMGVSLGGTPGHYEKIDNPSIAIEDSPELPPLHEVFGAYRSDDGVWRLPPLSLEMASPDAALHLGPATHRARDRCRGGRRRSRRHRPSAGRELPLPCSRRAARPDRSVPPPRPTPAAATGLASVSLSMTKATATGP